MTEQERATALQERARAASLTLLAKMHGTAPYYVLMDASGLPVATGTLSTVELCPFLSQVAGVDYPHL
jgi:hypothetical protein